MMEKVSIRGTQTISQTIEVTQEEVLSALWKSVGMGAVHHPKRDTCWKRTEDKLIEMEDISYHGSPQLEPTGVEITDPIKLKQYDLLKQLEETFKEKEDK